jgi:hypothetical protein
MLANPFAELSTLISSSECTLADLLPDPNVFDAFQRQHADLDRYLVASAGDFLGIALGVVPSAHRPLCRRMLFRIPIGFARRVALSPAAVTTLAGFLVSASPSRSDDVALCCYLVQHFSKISGGRFLLLIADGATFCERLLDLAAELPTARDLVVAILGDGHPDFVAFLDRVNAAAVLWRRYEGGGVAILSLIELVANCCDAHSVCLQFLSAPPRVAAVFDQAIGAPTRELRDSAMTILYEMCSHCDDEDDGETSMIARVFRFVIDNVDRLAAFVGASGTFGPGKSRAIEIIQAVVSTEDSVPTSVVRAAGGLFTQMVQQPNFSILHCATFTIFKIAVGADEDEVADMLKHYRVKEEIMVKFREGEIMRPYDAHLAKVAQMVKDVGEAPPGWTDFVEGPLAEITRLLKCQYGGDHPNKSAGNCVLRDGES